MLSTPGNYTPSSEYPTLKQITLRPEQTLQFDYKLLSRILLRNSIKPYKNVFEQFKSVAEDHNVDLFLCDVVANDACLDAAYVLNKPAVGT